MSNKTITRNFSKRANSYDQYAYIQRIVAKDLLAKIVKYHRENILDIGCGTGIFTQLLAKQFPKSQITAFDFSENMIKLAKDKLKTSRVEFQVAAIEDFSSGKKFDLITANASLHWLEDLNSFLWRYKNMLNQSGIIVFSLFGRETFYELNQALELISSGKEKIAAAKFLRKEDLEGVLKANFSKVELERKIYKQEFKCLKDLLDSIKYCGIRGESVYPGLFWTAKRISKLEDIYREKFSKIKVSYEVFFCLVS